MKLKEDNGEYYIGQIKNDSKNGIGKEFNKDDSLKYVGTFINGKYEGLGKYIYKNGMYYQGYWKNI